VAVETANYLQRAITCGAWSSCPLTSAGAAGSARGLVSGEPCSSASAPPPQLRRLFSAPHPRADRRTGEGGGSDAASLQ